MKYLAALFLICTLSSHSFSNSNITNQEALDFFELYHELMQENSKSVLQLISDDAEFYSKSYPISGAPYISKYDLDKVFRFINTVQDFIHQNSEVSEFERIKVTQDGRLVTIKAKRFSNTNCYLDNDYYVIIERRRNFIKVVEELIGIKKGSSCEDLDDIVIEE